MKLLRGLPLSPLRLRTLASCTLGGKVASDFLARGRHAAGMESRWTTRTVLWCEHSYLMTRIPGGWRLTPAGESALRLAFVAACEGWHECQTCSRVKPPAEFLGKSGRVVASCQHPHFCDCDPCLNGTHPIAHKAEGTWRRLRGPRLLPWRFPVGAE